MGTKRRIAPTIAEITHNLKRGPFLDLFSGVCAVGESIGTERSVWCNDIQVFASTVAKAFFQSKNISLTSIEAADKAYSNFERNKEKLYNRFVKYIDQELEELVTSSPESFGDFYSQLPHVGNDSKLQSESKRLKRKSSTFPYRLFSITFAGGYIGLKQAIEIDSIRYSIDVLRENRVIDQDLHRWWILALCQATCKVSTTTGHFAQYLKIKDNNCRHFVNQRKKSVWLHWLDAIDELVPIGWADWRSTNRVFNEDALELVNKMMRYKIKPAVVYADPPYTNDQYSRYYHLYETLILYDYPTASGVGRYRGDRFQSPFCSSPKVMNAFTDLIDSVAGIGSDFIISYPEVGLLPNAKEQLPKLMKKKYRSVEITNEVDIEHSTLGASKGYGKYSAKELLILGRRAYG